MLISRSSAPQDLWGVSRVVGFFMPSGNWRIVNARHVFAQALIAVYEPYYDACVSPKVFHGKLCMGEDHVCLG